MSRLFNHETLDEVVAGLREIGYQDDLLHRNYSFIDWFKSKPQEREIAVAAFGQTPVSYDSALLGVACTNGIREKALVDQYRALGAPIILEIDGLEVREWAVSGQEGQHALVERYPIDQVRKIFVDRAPEWTPTALSRAKNIGAFHWTVQMGLFAGLLPELEEQIQSKLEPQLDEALATTRSAYKDETGRDADPSHLFKLMFWLLTAKVFHDRGVAGFKSLASDPDELLSAIARYYKIDAPRFLTRKAREVAASFIWVALDFRNLSVEVLSQMWATFLIDKKTRRDLGIYRTSRTIVRYILEKIPFTQSGNDERIIFEPCSGSAGFLIGAMNALRPNLFGMAGRERHDYFRKHLAAMETDPLGVEISRLALTLADFPNPTKWNIASGDVFLPGAMTSHLQKSGVVLCNPPFGEFRPAERRLYKTSSPYKPVELLTRVLKDLHPSGVLGFVLPRAALDGQSYKGLRKQLTTRFANVDVTSLPDRAFEKASTETCLVIATDPIPHKSSRVTFQQVNDNQNAWWRFALLHEISFSYVKELQPEEAEARLSIPALPEVWDFLKSFDRLYQHAEIQRGFEWNKRLVDEHKRETGFRSEVVRETSNDKDFRLGVPPKAKFNVFDKPRLRMLGLRQEDERGNSYSKDWDKPKVIVNKAGRSRGPWKMAAFPDNERLVFYQTFIGVWPTSKEFDIWEVSAVLNSPIANAFVATREGKTDITAETLKQIPMPAFSQEQRARLHSLVKEYQAVIGSGLGAITERDPERLLMEIDAVVLDGYHLTPRLENELLNYFRGQRRPTSHYFGDFLPPNCEAYFSLSDHLSPKLSTATIGELLKRSGAS